MSRRGLEIKVGLLVLLSAGLLAAFIFVLGNFSTHKGKTFYVDFTFVGNLAKGAPVKVSGIKVGKVQSIEFLAGKYDPKVKRRVYVRLKLWVENRALPAIRSDSEFYINTEGVLGEQYVEITPGTMGDKMHPGVRSAQVMLGKAPPRADLIVARLYSFLDVVTKLLEDQKDNIGEAIRNTTKTLNTANDILVENREQIHKLLQTGETLAGEATLLAKSFRRGVGNGAKLERLLDRTDRVTGVLAKRLDPTLDRVDRALDATVKVAGLVGPKERDKLMAVLDRVVRLADRADRIAGNALAVIRRIRKGQGTAGALVMNRELYEDLKELVRDLRRNPWKFFWKE